MREGPGKPPPDKDESQTRINSKILLEDLLSRTTGPYPQVSIFFISIIMLTIIWRHPSLSGLTPY